MIGAGGSVSFPVEGSNVEGVLAVGMKADQKTLRLTAVKDELLWFHGLRVLFVQASHLPVTHLQNDDTLDCLLLKCQHLRWISLIGE